MAALCTTFWAFRIQDLNIFSYVSPDLNKMLQEHKIGIYSFIQKSYLILNSKQTKYSSFKSIVISCKTFAGKNIL